MGTECNSDGIVVNSVSEQLLCEQMIGFVFIPVSMWVLYVIVTEL